MNNIGSAGQNVRRAYQRRLDTDPTKDYYYIQRLTPNTESLLIEYGFIDNANDVRKLDNNLLDYAEAVVKAVSDYAGVPYSPPDTSDITDVYIVKAGDTMYSIAKKFGVSIDELKSYNKLSNNFLSIGQILMIPGLSSDSSTDNSNDTYIVKAGDTLYGIANKYGITVDELKAYNNLTNNNLSIGQVLFIPTIINNSGNNTYVVKAGDTLYGIANKYGITVDELKSYNNLTSNNLSIGQVLSIPSANTYVVLPSDTLYEISRKTGVPVNTLKSLNNLNSDLLFVGQVLNLS